MKTFAQRMPIPGTPRSKPLLIAVASLLALFASHALAPKLQLAAGDPIPALEAWPALVAAALGLGVWRFRSRTLSGTIAAAMTLSLLLAATAALLQAAFATGFAAAILAGSALVFFSSALAALDVALTRLAADHAKRF